MEIKLMNFCRIRDGKGRVVVQDKVKKVGWEGLTFPGGKVEGKESLFDACIREIQEETGLILKKIKYCGVLQWVFPDREDRELVFLFDAEEFTGDIVGKTHEGRVFWMEEEALLKATGKADFFDAYYRVIDDDSVREALCLYGEDGDVEIRFY